jgi:hypothetical protein
MYQSMYQNINLYYTNDQLYTKTSVSMMHQHLYNKKCINHPPTLVPCTSTINHVHQHMYHTVYQQCISTIYHIPYHSIMPYTIYHNISSFKCLKKVPNNQDHIPSIFLSHASNMCLKHVSMTQQYTKELPQACNITPSTCNPQNININIHVNL